MSADRLAVHRGVMQAFGPRDLANITGNLSPADVALLEQRMPVHLLVCRAYDRDGRIVDQDAHAELQRLGDGGAR